MIKEKEDLSYNEDTTSRNDGELEKLKGVETDAQEWKTLVLKEDEPTSPESHDTIKEVVKTISEMAPWGEMFEEIQIVKVTPMSKVEECITQLCKKMHHCGKKRRKKE